MSKATKLSNEIEKKLAKNPTCSRSQMLTIIIEELFKAGKLRSCVLTDENGLFMAEIIHPLAEKENISAVSALSGEFSERISDYLKIGPLNYSYLESGNTKVWTKIIKLPHTAEQYILMATKDNSLLEKLSKADAEKLHRRKKLVAALLDIAADWIKTACKD